MTTDFITGQALILATDFYNEDTELVAIFTQDLDRNTFDYLIRERYARLSEFCAILDNDSGSDSRWLIGGVFFMFRLMIDVYNILASEGIVTLHPRKKISLIRKLTTPSDITIEPTDGFSVENRLSNSNDVDFVVDEFENRHKLQWYTRPTEALYHDQISKKLNELNNSTIQSVTSVIDSLGNGAQIEFSHTHSIGWLYMSECFMARYFQKTPNVIFDADGISSLKKALSDWCSWYETTFNTKVTVDVTPIK